MPKQVEIAELEVNGQIFRNWTSVEVVNAANAAALVSFHFTASEKTKGTSLNDLKVVPGDKCSVRLAGVTVVKDGLVQVRSAAIDATEHQVQILGTDRSGELKHSDVPLRGNQFKKSTFEQIAKKVLKPHGVNLKMVNAGKDAGKAFRDVCAIPGESVFDFIDRLARMRNLHLWASPDGTINAGNLAAGGSGGADLVEGQNILAASCKIDGQGPAGDIEVVGMDRGDDNVSDEDARKPAAKTKTKQYGGDGRKRVVVSEGVGDADDMRIRADREAAAIAGSMIEVTVIVQGWLKPSGGLWEAMKEITVDAPSLLLKPGKPKLGIQQVIFSQDQSGTKTTLNIVSWPALAAVGPSDLIEPSKVEN